METIIDHVIEPAVAGPPPRVTRLPLSTNLLLLAATLLFGLFLYGGSRALLESLKLGWLEVSGRTITAHIQEVFVESPAGTVQDAPLGGVKKDGPPRQVGLTYVYTLPFGPDRRHQYGTARLEAPPDVDPQRPQETLANSTTAVPTFKVGQTLPLRCALWLGRPIVYPWQSAPTGKIVFLMLCGGLVIAISALLLRRIFRWRRHRLHLLRQGVATVGTVTHREARSEDAPRYYIRYGYAAGAEPCEHEEQVSIEQWKRLEVGQPVTVLYDPDRVEDASLYVLLGKP